MTAMTEHPLAILIGIGIFLGLLGILWVAGKNWKAMRAIQEELHGAIQQVVPPLIDKALTEHNRDEDAHEAAANKVRKERNEMFDALRDRMDEQHRTVIVAITKLETNQVNIAATLAKVDMNLTRLKAEHDRIVASEQLRARRYSDPEANGDHQGERHANCATCIRRATDPAGEDHTKERAK